MSESVVVEEVLHALKAQGICVRPEWLVEYSKFRLLNSSSLQNGPNERSSSATTSVSTLSLKRAAFEQFVSSDLKQIGSPQLPPDLSTWDKKVDGLFVAQLL